jgi:pimeloyl-ACP methyl ester carboxylesterase
MNTAIDGRQAISVTVGGLCLRGTYHTVSSKSTPSGNCVGLLFLNPGFTPRAALGDSAVYWCDSLARLGYPCFRFDLAGLGDSDGEAPPQILDFINKGGYAAAVSALIKALVERYALAGMLLAGHCAGAVTAIFAAPLTKECVGLVLTDPYFFLPQDRTRFWLELRSWSTWSRIGAMVSSIYYMLRHLRLLIGRNRPPRNANLPLLRCWNQLSSAGLPMLVLKAPALKSSGLKPRIGEFDYLGYLQSIASPRNRVSIQLIEDTNHSFADKHGRTAVRENIEQWLKHFSQAPRGRGVQRASSITPEDAYEALSPR